MVDWLKTGNKIIYISENEGPVDAKIIGYSPNPFSVEISFFSCFDEHNNRVEGPEENYSFEVIKKLYDTKNIIPYPVSKLSSKFPGAKSTSGFSPFSNKSAAAASTSGLPKKPTASASTSNPTSAPDKRFSFKTKAATSSSFPKPTSGFSPFSNKSAAAASSSSSKQTSGFSPFSNKSAAASSSSSKQTSGLPKKSTASASTSNPTSAPDKRFSFKPKVAASASSSGLPKKTTASASTSKPTSAPDKIFSFKTKAATSSSFPKPTSRFSLFSNKSAASSSSSKQTSGFPNFSEKPAAAASTSGLPKKSTAFASTSNPMSAPDKRFSFKPKVAASASSSGLPEKPTASASTSNPTSAPDKRFSFKPKVAASSSGLSKKFLKSPGSPPLSPTKPSYYPSSSTSGVTNILSSSKTAPPSTSTKQASPSLLPSGFSKFSKKNVSPVQESLKSPPAKVKQFSFGLKSPPTVRPVAIKKTRSQAANIRNTILKDNCLHSVTKYSTKYKIEIENNEEIALSWAEWCTDIKLDIPEYMKDWDIKLGSTFIRRPYTGNKASFEGTLTFSKADMIQYAYDLKNSTGSKVAILNMANATTPGGGYFRNAESQESQLCLRSDLLPRLKLAQEKGYYGPKGLRIGETLYTADVSFIRNSDSLPVGEQSLDVISAAAINYTGKNAALARAIQSGAIDKDFESTWRNIIYAATDTGVDHLVVSVIGAGVFSNPLDKVIDGLLEALDNLVDPAEKITIHMVVGDNDGSKNGENTKKILEKKLKTIPHKYTVLGI